MSQVCDVLRVWYLKVHACFELSAKWNRIYQPIQLVMQEGAELDWMKRGCY